MNAIILAAGDGTRMGRLTTELPKPLIDINGISIIERQINHLRKNSISKIIIITGTNHKKFNISNVQYIYDQNSKSHDQLGSLMCAKNNFCDDILIIFGDIVFEESILTQILESDNDIVLAVDMNWKKSYIKRTNNSFDDADKVTIQNGKAIRIFKNFNESDDESNIGEFLGLMKLSKNGSTKLYKCYQKLMLSHSGTFHDAESLEKAKLIDLLQELLEQEIEINTISITGKWCEIDTEQDLSFAEEIF
jgi:L-glutamine-phosphate cytidylyltransferase